MQVPVILCGRAAAVSAAWRRRVTALRGGGPWIDPAMPLVDVDDVPGLIALDGPSPLLGGDDNIHAYMPMRELGRALDAGRIAAAAAAPAFDAALAAPWGVLGLLSQWCHRWLADSARAARVLDAAISGWDVLDAPGARYSMGSRTGARLWELPHLLKHLLARRGVPHAALAEPLPPGGPAALLRAGGS